MITSNEKAYKMLAGSISPKTHHVVAPVVSVPLVPVLAIVHVTGVATMNLKVS